MRKILVVSREHMIKEQRSYQRICNRRTGLPKPTLRKESLFLVRLGGHRKDAKRYKLTSMAYGSYTVVSQNDETIVLRVKCELERVSRDSMVQFPRQELIMEHV